MQAKYLVAFLLLTASPEAAATQWAERCAPNTAESRQGAAALKKLEKNIQALPPDGDPAPLVRQLEALLATRCFQIARDEQRGHFDSGLSLTSWWKSGGHDWLASLLRGPGELVLPPAARSTLRRDGTPEQPPAALLCGLAEAACGGETSGWVERAEAALAARALAAAAAERQATAASAAAEESRAPRDPADCLARAQKAAPERRYQKWHACIVQLHPRQDALPVGRLRAPAHGFLVVRGRRGHYEFCDELRAYDLASGAAYVATSCSGLALAADGRVDGRRTDAGRRAQLLTGHLPVDNLREAAWMALLLGKIDRGRSVQTYRIAIPPDIRPQLPLDERLLVGMQFGSEWFTSAQTQLVWSWLDGGQLLGRGTLTWPDSSHAAADYAVELLRIAEAGMQPGCPPQPPSPPDPLPPARLLAGAAPGVNRVDAPTGVAPIQQELLALLAQAPRCPAVPAAGPAVVR